MSNWWEENKIKFECQGSGKCCTSHGEYGFVFMTIEDRRRMAKVLGLATQVFTKKYCEKKSGVFHLIERKGEPDCLFLKNKRCTVYEGRPTQCRTWPFWPEVMNAKTWNKEVKAFCPGVGKGTVVNLKKIKLNLEDQTRSEEMLLKERLK